jgi:hypothetical protein
MGADRKAEGKESQQCDRGVVDPDVLSIFALLFKSNATFGYFWLNEGDLLIGDFFY